MKYTSIVSMKYLLSALAITLFLLLSCGVAENTSPGGSSTPDYMSFSLSNSDGAPVSTSTALERAISYKLTIKRENIAPLLTEDYTFVVNPVDAIRVDVRRSNSIDFTVNNNDATSVTITATHKDNPVITKTLELKLAARADFMSFAVANSDGDILTPTTALIYRSNYMVTITPTDKPPLRTAEYDITFSPEVAITGTATNANSISFRVNDGSTSVKITATHKNNSSITETLSLTLEPRADFMSFTLTNRSGTLVDNTTIPLARASSYGVSVKRESGAGEDAKTADYTFSVSPADAIRVDVGRSNSIDFTVKNTAATSVSITATHKGDASIVETLVLNLAPQADFMSFAVSNIGGALLNASTPLTHGESYVVSITPSSASPLQTADYDIAFIPADAITGLATNANSISFRVNNGTTALKITATHKGNPIISGSLDLSFKRDYMSFTLSDSSDNPVDSTTTELTRAGRYRLNVKRESGAELETADYIFSASPADAITINVRRTNGIDFIVNNTSATSVRITATHKDTSTIKEDLTLNFAPQAGDFMNFVLTNRSGTVDLTTALARANSYGLTINPTSDAPLVTANYNITVTPADAITINNTSPNSIDFTVKNTDVRSVTITATHKDDASITESLVLSLAPQADFMSFVLTNRSGTVDMTTALARINSYGLTINPSSVSPLQTADYIFVASPEGAITIDVRRTNAIDFTVNNTSDIAVTITATHKDNPVITGTLTLNLRERNTALTPFATDIQGDTVPNLAVANALTREVLTPLEVSTGTPLVKRYATSNGGGSYDGSSWANAWAATNLRNGINAIADASASKVYLIMIAGGTYKPTYDTTRAISFSMKNHVAIMGGFKDGGGWERTGTTLMSGDIGTAGSTNDNSYHVFFHNNISLGNSHLYGVTITNANANGGTSVQKRGGGMYNSSSSPNLTRVVFSGNSATEGGGMYNDGGSSPVLNRVVFSGNTANNNGGGMFNISASPVINTTVFSGNSAVNRGGGMYNEFSSPVISSTVFSDNTAKDGAGIVNRNSYTVINNTVFSGNTAISDGGGMYNQWSSPVLVGTVFTGNSAVNGGGMANDNDSGYVGISGPHILNTIFSGNTTNNGTGAGPDIAVKLSGFGAEDISIAGSVLGTYLTTGQPTNAIVGYGESDTMNINYHSASLNRNAVNLGTATLTVNGMDFTYSTITAGSSAINLGLYVRKSGSGDSATYYFSADNNTWYSGFTTTGNFDGAAVTPPADAEDLTATDITGKARTGRPDAGVNEL